MPFLGPIMTSDRNQIFQCLKPPCVALSQAALALNGPQGDVRQLTERLAELKKTLERVTARPAALDEKLADYVFFPLSQVLKISQRASIRALELSLQCLAILLEHGWRSQIHSQLVAQIVILCTLMAEESPKGLSSAQSTDELRASALQCLRYVFEAAGGSTTSKELLTAESNVPQLGQTISTILDGVAAGRSVESQVAGSYALQALLQRVATRDVQAGFLPGIVSKLTKVLTPRTTHRPNHEVLILALETLAYLFRNILSDEVTIELVSSSIKQDKASAIGQLSKVVDQKWLDTAATQLKPAIANIVKVRVNDRRDVKESLGRFCLTVLHCRNTLRDSAPMCLETLLMLSSEHTESLVATQLEVLVTQDSSMLALLQNTMHEWLSSLPTKMQAADEQAKVMRVQQISTAYGVLVSSDADMSLVDKMLAGALRDSVVATLQSPSSQSKGTPAVSQVQSLELAVLDSGHNSKVFQTPLVKHQAQHEILRAIEHLTHTISGSSSSVYTLELSRALRKTIGEAQIATFWLFLNATQSTLKRKGEFEHLLNLDSQHSSLVEEQLEDLYSFSLEVLTDDSEEAEDRRLRALALRTLALRSQIAKEGFRHELIDALYSVLHSLATPDPMLQQDSITTLNIFASSCGYSSVESLIVENVDYLTNAVSLRLNAFDVSPQAPQVLLMMVRLAGPSLLPYLEDTIDSIFAALQDYHGYPLLVELLFRVLGVVAEEGAKEPQLAITQGVNHNLARYYEDRRQSISIDDLVNTLQEQASEQARLAGEGGPRNADHPKRPWKHATEADDGEDDVENESEQDEQEQQPVDIPDPPPPAPKTYNLLLRISELTQHFLPSASASLRASLLNLIKTTTPAIARHENSFLPLVNTLWPEIVSRLDDPEPHVVATALDIIASLCEYAKGFMRTRIQQLWPELCEMHRKLAKEIVQNMQPQTHAVAKAQAATPNTTTLTQALVLMRAAPADYSDTSTRLLWSSLVAVLVCATKYVSLTPDMFDDVLAMLEPALEDEDVRTTLEAENADAVWLVLLRNGKVGPPPLHGRENTIHLPFVKVAG